MDSICLNKNVLTLKHVLEIVSTSFYSLNLRKCVNIREVSAMYNLSDMSILRNVRDITIVRGDVVDISALGNVHSLARYSIAKISRTCRRSETSTMIGCENVTDVSMLGGVDVQILSLCTCSGYL